MTIGVHPIEAKFLRPEVHTLRNVHRPVVTASEQDRLVLMVADSPSRLEKTYASKYLKYGETHTFVSGKSKAVPVPHRSTCAAREREHRKWYDLTNLARESFALWPKATQYGHMAPYNPESLIANCRLYYLSKKPGQSFDELVFAAILNSTLVSFWKSFYGRYTGMEGSLDTEVVDVNLIDVPRPEIQSAELRARIVSVFTAMQSRDVGPMVEEVLLECRSPERARKIAEGPLNLPREFTQPDRRELDDAVFEVLGMYDAARRKSLIERLYRETALHFRWIRVGEIQKMEQRKKSASRRFSTEELAADLWDAAEIEDLTPLREWIAKQSGMISAVIVPDGSPAHLSVHAKMFDNDTVYFGANRKDHVVCRSREEAELVKLVADLGVHGTIHVPEDPAQCKALGTAIEERVGKAKTRFHELAQTRTSLEDKQEEVVGLLLRWFALGRRASVGVSPDSEPPQLD